MSVEITVTDSGVVIDVSPSGIGVVGVGIPSGGSTGQVLTKTSATNYAVAWQTPGGGGGGLASDWATLGSNLGLSAGSFVDAVSMSLAAGTWLLVGNATASAEGNHETISTRILSGATTVSSTSIHSEHGGEGYGTAVSALVTLAATTTVKLQVRILTSSGTVYAAYEGLGNTSTTLAAVQIA
jgi:hypothetical protein